MSSCCYCATSCYLWRCLFVVVLVAAALNAVVCALCLVVIVVVALHAVVYCICLVVVVVVLHAVVCVL